VKGIRMQNEMKEACGTTKNKIDQPGNGTYWEERQELARYWKGKRLETSCPLAYMKWKKMKWVGGG